MNKPINFTKARKQAFINPEQAEAITAKRHYLRSQLCLRGWGWHEADAESWRIATLAQFGANPIAAAQALFSGEAA
ncbi:hypothetical protein [Alkalilacustris brevis]|uniref:hypothetical protein n=1 Tax=Alkalilacustris brevis TaxID=2026338 RepID=UPI000E0DDCD6|nr:hypothetical protein [Alkalilacustris brevis]